MKKSSIIGCMKKDGRMPEKPDFKQGEKSSKKPAIPFSNYVLVAPPLPVPKAYLYGVPPEIASPPLPGCRVFVPQRTRTVLGYVVETGGPELLEREGVAPDKIKPVERIKDKQPLVNPEMLDIARFVAKYYHCGLGEAVEAMLPAGVRSGVKANRERMAVPRLEPERLEAEAAALETRAPKQAAILRTLAALTPPVPIAELLDAASANARSLQSLAEKGFLAVHEEIPTDELLAPAPDPKPPPKLTTDQARAVEAVTARIGQGKYGTFLLEGVTGSGKTEIYLRALRSCVDGGKTGIVLVPEISLTPQTVMRFRARFERVAVLHSHLTSGQRADQWRRIAAGEVDVVVGARSAVFAPIPRLGLIVIDEEHETSFKQENAPRYHARDTAVQRAFNANAVVVLGSATPSLESWHNAKIGKYIHLFLPERVTPHPLPAVRVIDMLREDDSAPYWKAGLSRSAVESLEETLSRGRQSIFFLNRRGHNVALKCPKCGWTARCDSCAVAMTYHKHEEKLLCHYCGAEKRPPKTCPGCGREGFYYLGTGTERVQAALETLFPSAVVARMDSDTMKKRGSYARTLSAFRRGETDVLVGTQMIAKGLDFPNVTLVVIINADTALEFPDFRASERTFQLISQVAGRAGRGEEVGRVLVQTWHAFHPAVRFAAMHDFSAFANSELPARRHLGYPPYSRMARIIWRGKKLRKVAETAANSAAKLRRIADSERINILFKGPVPCPVEKIQDNYRYHALVLSPFGYRQILELYEAGEKALASTKYVHVAVDTEPQAIM